MKKTSLRHLPANTFCVQVLKAPLRNNIHVDLNNFSHTKLSLNNNFPCRSFLVFKSNSQNQISLRSISEETEHPKCPLKLVLLDRRIVPRF